MPTCRDIITRALRKARVYAAGEEPSAEDMADGLDELQNLYEQWGSGGMFGRLSDVHTNADYEASPGERVVLTEDATVTIPETIYDDGSDYPPYDLSFIEVIAPDSVTRYLYSGGRWVEIGALGLDDEAPLANRGRGGLAACLALAYAEEFGAEVGPGVARQAAAFKTALSLKMGSDAARTAPDYF